MGKLKKISIAFVGLIVLFYIVNLVTSDEIERVIPTSTVANDKPTSLTNDQPKEKSYMMMSDSELLALSLNLEYRDLLRNIDEYSKKIIFVEGEVASTDRDRDELVLCTSTKNAKYGIPYICGKEDFIVKVNRIDTWIEDDILRGYVEITGKVKYSTDIIVKEIKLTCSNC